MSERLGETVLLTFYEGSLYSLYLSIGVEAHPSVTASYK